MTLTRDRRRNRIYFEGVDADLASALNLRYDGARRWCGVADYPGETRIKQVAAELAADKTAAAEYAAAKSAIPADYKTRHGAMFGGVVTFDGETDTVTPVGGGVRNAAWKMIATHAHHAHGGLIEGRVQDSDTLYGCALPDGRMAYRETHYASFGDDVRETYYLPADIWLAVCMAEFRACGITPERARQWLAQYRGCVDTELYEYAASM